MTIPTYTNFNAMHVWYLLLLLLLLLCAGYYFPLSFKHVKQTS